VPLAHDAVAFGRLQPTPQPPQFASVFNGVSQPFVTSPSQLPKPPSHVGAHTPPLHAIAPWSFVHGRSQPPQCPVDVNVFTSQPVAGSPSQSPRPASHASTAHVPVSHVSVAKGSAHVTPQAPQCASVLTRVSQPSSGSPLQLPNPDSHVGVQTAAEHRVVPCALVHALPH
jgi:hypothetical protein